MVDFKPSQIDPFKRSMLPFLATFRRTESEIMAAMLVGALQMHGDEWRPVKPQEVGFFLKKMGENDGDAAVWNTLCMCGPHPEDLIKDGYCRFVGEHKEGQMASIEFTEKGMEKLKDWVTP